MLCILSNFNDSVRFHVRLLFVFALPGFLGRPGIVLPYKNCPVDTFSQKKAPTFQSRLCVRVTYLPGQSPAKYCRRT